MWPIWSSHLHRVSKSHKYTGGLSCFHLLSHKFHTSNKQTEENNSLNIWALELGCKRTTIQTSRGHQKSRSALTRQASSWTHQIKSKGANTDVIGTDPDTSSPGVTYVDTVHGRMSVTVWWHVLRFTHVFPPSVWTLTLARLVIMFSDLTFPGNYISPLNVLRLDKQFRSASKKCQKLLDIWWILDNVYLMIFNLSGSCLAWMTLHFTCVFIPFLSKK